ncbi:uncharacterized protein [Kogia breviceps]|uniref:uncharacterized protein n=1 Tax=Kogia breviceps TaxID=27615 RepID=UPI0034D1743D
MRAGPGLGALATSPAVGPSLAAISAKEPDASATILDLPAQTTPTGNWNAAQGLRLQNQLRATPLQDLHRWSLPVPEVWIWLKCPGTGSGCTSRTDGASPQPTRDPERGRPRLPGTWLGGRAEVGKAAPWWQRATRKGRRVQDGSGTWLQAQPLLHGDAALLTPRDCSGRWSGGGLGSGISISEIRRAGLAAKRTGVFAGGQSTVPGAPQKPQGQLREDEGGGGARGHLAPPLTPGPRIRIPPEVEPQTRVWLIRCSAQSRVSGISPSSSLLASGSAPSSSSSPPRQRRPILSSSSRRRTGHLANCPISTAACRPGKKGQRVAMVQQGHGPPASSGLLPVGRGQAVLCSRAPRVSPDCAWPHGSQEESEMALPSEDKEARGSAGTCPCTSQRHKCPWGPLGGLLLLWGSPGTRDAPLTLTNEVEEGRETKDSPGEGRGGETAGEAQT